jgi:2-polyprenyl-3-methyl-5-hydroxy-6-metoxy-1,4-benzoquinol methylase
MFSKRRKFARNGHDMHAVNPINVLEHNIRHYTTLYSALDEQLLIRRASDPSFFTTAIKTHTSWYGLYRDNFAQRIAGARVLELGFGDGLNALIMARLGAKVTAVEIAEPAVRALQSAADRLGYNVLALHGDFLTMRDLPRFDFIVGKAFLHHLDLATERAFLRRTAALLSPSGEARFQEPAVNCAALDAIRWMIPVPGRPSILNHAAFQAWKERDPHPQRDQSSRHYEEAGREFFDDVRVLPFGALERFRRLIRRRSWSERYAAWALRAETAVLSESLAATLARSHTIVLTRPRSH